MPYGLLHTLVAADQVPAYERWASRDRQAIGDYDVAPALRKPDDSWEHGLGQRILEFQVGRAHVAVLYGSEKESVLEPVRYAQSLLEDVIAKSGGDQDLEIAPWPGLRKSATDSGVWKNLGLVYQALSRVDRSYVSQFGVACERFVARADRSDPDLPAARAYLRRMRAAP
jgi:streptomycin 6-kinase